jgi:hypothetical protein
MSMHRRLVGCGFAVFLAGCYTLQPARSGTLDAGTEVSLQINDAGRVALGGSMGPEIDQIEGKLLQKDPDQYVIAVSAVRLLRGGQQVWSKEQVSVKTEYVGRAYERRFSKARTLVVGGATVGGFVAFLATRELFGRGEEPPPAGPGDSVSTRIVRP